MSDLTPGGPTGPRVEKWVPVMMAAFVPVVLAMIVPMSLRVPLLIVGAALFVVGFALMLKRDRDQ
jgi:hypothetical protein